MLLRPRWNIIISNIWSHKFRSLLVIASITVGLFAVGLITSMDIIILNDMEAGYQAVNPANIQVIGQSYKTDVLDSVRKVEGVSQAEGARVITLRYRNSKGEWEPIDIKAIPDIDKTSIDTVRLEQGQWPPADRQIAIDHYKFSDLPVGVGGSIELELPSGKIRQIPVVAVIHDQTIGSGGSGGFFIAPVQGYITMDTLDWLESPTTLNHIYATVTGDKNDINHIESISTHVVDTVESSGSTVNSSILRTANNHPNAVFVQAISAVLVVLGFLVMFLSALLITNTLAALLNQQIHHIGVMKTIGARRSQIVIIYTSLIFVYAMTAFVIAVPLAGWTAYILLEYFAKAINLELQGFRFEPAVILLMAGIAIIIPQLAGIIPIINGTRISVVEALSGYSQTNPQVSKSWLDKRIESIKGLSRPTLLSLRNTFRRKGRLFLTIFTLTLGGAIFIGTFNVQGSLIKYIDRIGRYFLADVNLTLKDNARINEIEDLVMQVPGVGHVEGWAATGGVLVKPDDTAGETVQILAPPAGSTLVDPVLTSGRWIQPGDTNAIVANERFKEVYPDLKVGDKVKIKISGKEQILDVVGFFKMTGKSGGILAYTNYEYLAPLIHSKNKAITFRILANRTDLTLEEQKVLGQQIETLIKSKGYQIAEVQAGKSLIATTANGLNILTGFLLIMAILIAIVGSIGLTGTMSLNVLERTREIGIVRAIGASDKAVMNLVMIEGVLIGMMSWVFGLIMAFPISSLMSNAINLALFGTTADFTFTPIGVFLWLVLVVLLSVFSSIGPARNATRLTIREVLSYE